MNITSISSSNNTFRYFQYSYEIAKQNNEQGYPFLAFSFIFLNVADSMKFSLIKRLLLCTVSHPVIPSGKPVSQTGIRKQEPCQLSMSLYFMSLTKTGYMDVHRICTSRRECLKTSMYSLCFRFPPQQPQPPDSLSSQYSITAS